MPDIIITPGSGLIDFYPSNKTASIFTSGNDLAFANPSGNFEFISGNIGIGTTTPSGKLTVVGSGIFTTLTTGLLPNALLYAYSAVSGDTVLNVEGTNGSLFSIVDSLSGTLMAVNNSAGLPVFEVFSDDSIVAGRFNQNDFVISSGGNVGIGTSSPVSKLQVSGLITANSGNFTNSLQLNGTGVSISGHTHTASNITDFNSAVSGLLPTIANSGDNRVLTSTGSSVGINAESGLTFDGTSLSSPILVSTNASALEGGEIQLAKAPSGSTSGNNVIIDVYQNQIRFFEQGGTNRGYYIDITSGGAGVATNLAAGGGGGGVNITNPSDNRVLTSTGSSSGINAEAGLTFDGNTLIATGNAYISQIIIDSNTVKANARNLILLPSGGYASTTYNPSGAIVANLGGSERGLGAVDLQLVRSNDNQVASGQYSVILGGSSNRAESSRSIILAGNTNAITGVQAQNACCGGASNTITGPGIVGFGANHSFVYGNLNLCRGQSSIVFGERCSLRHGPFSSILGGYSNSLSGLAADTPGYCTIAGGLQNTLIGAYGNFIGAGGGNTINALDGLSDANYSSAIVAGDVNTTYATYSFIGGGDYNTISASGGRSVIVGGNNNTVTASQYSSIGGGKENVITANYYSHIPGGYQAKTTKYGELSHAAGKFANAGDAQHTVLVARTTTVDNTANKLLFLDDGDPAGSPQRLLIPAQTTWTFEIKLSAYNDTDSAAAGWIYRGVIKRDGSNNTSLVGSIVEENWKDTAMSSATSSVVADDTNEALEIRVTGLLSKNIRWVAVIDISQVSYSAI